MMLMMPPMSDPSERSERMERADNPSKAMKWALIFGGVAALGTAAFLLTRKKRTPLPSKEAIAAGEVPGVSVDTGSTQVQIGLKSQANPFNVSVTSSPTKLWTDAELAQKVDQVWAWARPILAYGHYITMEGASMAGYRRLNGPFDAVTSSLGTLSKVASEAQQTVQQVNNFVSPTANKTATTSNSAPVYANNWPKVMDWLRTGRLPLDHTSPEFISSFRQVAYLGANWFATNSAETVEAIRAPLPAGAQGRAGMPLSATQINMIHSFTSQMYDLWTRGGAGAEAIPRDARFAPSMAPRYRNHPFENLRSQLNKG